MSVKKHESLPAQKFMHIEFLTFTASVVSTECNSEAEVVEGNEALRGLFSVVCGVRPAAEPI